MRLIDADALLDDLKSSANDAREWKEETQDEEIKIRAEQTFGTFVECALRVKNAPTIEAEPVRHGRWIEETEPDENGNVISMCNQCYHTDEHGKNIIIRYCWYCGAKMYADGGTISKERLAEIMRDAYNEHKMR